MLQIPLVPEIPTEVATVLASFDIQSRPTSERMVDTILQRLESENTSSILKSIIISFLCRLCHNTLDGTCARGDHHLKQDNERLITSTFNLEIFGIWFIDAAAIMVDSIHKSWDQKKIAGTLFMDVKGAFDYVSRLG